MHICRPIYYNIYEIECSSLRIFLRHLTWHSDDPTSSPAFFPSSVLNRPTCGQGVWVWKPVRCGDTSADSSGRGFSWPGTRRLELLVCIFSRFSVVCFLFFSTSLPFVFCYLYNRIDSHEHAETRLPTSVAILSCRLAHGWCIQICRVASKSSLLCPKSTIFRVNS